MLRHFARCVPVAALAVFCGCASLPPEVAYAPHYPPNFKIQLLPGYRMAPQQGIDTTTWRIWKPGGLNIDYDANDLPTIEPVERRPASTWIRECDWSEGPMVPPRPPGMPLPRPQNERGDADCSFWFDDESHGLVVSVGFPDGATFSARELKRVDEIREVLAIVLTYTPGSVDPAAFIDGPTLQRAIERGWNVRQNGPSLMGDAVRWEAVDVIAVLARAGVDVNGVNAEGVPYLHEAIGINLYQSARALLEAGAKPVVRTQKELFVPVGSAGASTEMLQLFLDRGVSVNLANSYGWTMLRAAIGAANIANVRALLDHGALINAQDSNGMTALMSAATWNLDIVALLIDRGAALDVRDREGKTALGLAEATFAGRELGIRRDEEALRALPATSAAAGAAPDVNWLFLTHQLERDRRDLAIAKDIAALLIKKGAKR